MGKNIVPILAFFLIALVAFLAMQLLAVTDKPLPEATQKQIRQINPKLNTDVIKDLKEASQN
jgi:hypothetical protein